MPVCGEAVESAVRAAFSRSVCFVLSLLTGLGGGLASPVLAQEAAAGGATAPATEEENSKALTDVQTVPDLVARERAINEVIKQGFEQGGQGVWQTLSGRKMVEIDPRTLALSALTRNLGIHRASLRKDIADAALLEAKALFDPVLNVSFNYNDTKDYKRKEEVVRFHRATIHCDTAASAPECARVDPTVAAGVFPHDLIFFDNGPVAFIGFNQPRPAEFRDEVDTAHDDGFHGHNEVYTLDFTLQQQLPWGANVTLNYETRYKDNDFVNNPGSPTPTTGSYHRPWTAALSASFTAPIPYSKNYGPNSAAADVANKLAALGDERAMWDVKNVINSTLLAVDLAYWDLVGNANNLYAAVENQNSVEKLLEKTEKMYELREITDYSHAQVQAELERVRGEVEQAKTAYVQASNALQPLLDSGADTVYLPTTYTASLASPIEVDPAQVRAEMVQDNPQLQAQTYDVKAENVVLRQKDRQTYPDVNFSATVNAVQLNSTFGYSDWHKSAEALLQPDLVNQTYNLTLTRPWGNRAANAAQNQAEHNLRAAELGVRGTQNSLTRALADATVGVLSARVRTDITRRNWELAQTAYNKAVSQQRSRTVTEYEIIRQSGQLLSATRDWIAAVIQAKQAEALWLAARGELPAKYAERTAQTATDQVRVKALADNRLTPLFATEKADAH